MTTKNTTILRQEVAEHIAVDAVMQGQYWTGERGCFIGCLTHSSDPEPAVDRFGLTLSIMRIAEFIFERLPADEAKAFFAAFPGVVERDGKDLSRVHWAFLAEELRSLPKVPDDVQEVIDPVIAGMDLLAAGREWSSDAAESAAWDAAPNAAQYAAQYAAGAAAWAARAAAQAAARDAARDAAQAAARDAARAAEAAGDAAWAAEAAGDAARAAAGAATVAHVIKRQRDTLLRLISEAPEGEHG
jgi:hypothetical protein